MKDSHPTTITDVDGNVYHAVKIGNQWWLQENLKTTRYRDGSAIPEVDDSKTWSLIASTFYSTKQARSSYSPQAHTPAWCYCQNNKGNNDVYGKLYNQYVVVDPRNVCPSGWHVPSDPEFQVLSDYLGGDDIAGGKMKAIKLWQPPVAGDTNDNTSGFTALAGGGRFDDGHFAYSPGVYCYFWCSTRTLSNEAYARSMLYTTSLLKRELRPKGDGFSVRCVEDVK